MPLQNPHLSNGTLGTDQPLNLDGLPFERPNTPAGKEAVRLHKLAAEATAHLQSVRDAQIEATRRLQTARAAFQEAVVASGTTKVDLEHEERLATELGVAERLADGATHQLRYRTAVQKQREAVLAYRSHCWERYLDLLEELRPDAERAGAELTKALAQVQPVQDRYLDVANRVQELSRLVAAGPDGPSWNQRLRILPAPEPPMPSAEAIETFRRARQTPAELEVIGVD